MKKTKISIYGLGNFGYAFLKHFDKKRDGLLIYGYDKNKELMNYSRKHRQHLFLHQDYQVSRDVVFTQNIQELLLNCQILLLAVPSFATREAIRKIKPYLPRNLIIVNTAKALDYQTGRRLSRVIQDELKSRSYHYAFFAGGTIAADLFKHEPLGATLACENKKILSKLVPIFQSSNLRVYPSRDLIGTEYAAAFKNVISILAGVIKGLGFSFGSETHLISLVADEIEQIVTKKLGGKKETFSMKSQAWGNDLWMSSLGPTRNREFGILLGKGILVQKALNLMKKQNKTVEGVNTVKILNKIIPLKNYPLLNFLHQLITKQNVKIEKISEIIFSNNI